MVIKYVLYIITHNEMPSIKFKFQIIYYTYTLLQLTFVDRCGPFQQDWPLSYNISRYLLSSGPTQLFQVPSLVSAPPVFGLCVTC